MFSKQLIDYTVSTFSASKIDIFTKTMVQEIKENSVVLKTPDGAVKDVPCGMVIWAAGNTARQVTKDLMNRLSEHQTNKRGVLVDGVVSHSSVGRERNALTDFWLDNLVMKGTDGSVFAIGDCTASSYAPTAQVASQQGAYLARVFKQLAKRDELEAKLLAGGDVDESRAKRQMAKYRIRPFHYSHQGSLA
jgi:NADH:ubiquinone reductase (non-electrogenic)